MIRVVVAGTSNFGLPSFQQLLSTPSIRIVGVISQPAKPTGRRQHLTPSPVEHWAKANSLPLYTPPTWRTAESVEQLRAWQPDVLLVAAYGLIVPPTVLSVPRHGCINIHASLLPAYRGASPISAAIAHGDTTTGITFMLMDAGMDTGPILRQYTCQIKPTDTTPILSQRLAALAAEHITSIISDLVSGTLTPQPQPSGATVAKKISREHGRMSWESGAHLARLARAYTPWPGLWTTWQGRTVKILSGIYLPQKRSEKTGTVVPHHTTWGIVCGDGLFVPEIIQFEGKQPQPAERIPGSYPNFLGSQLGY